MFKKLTNKKILKNQKGLTLVELLAVIVILAIISAIAIPSIGNIIENSKYNAAKADAINVLNAAQLYYTDSPTATSPVTVDTLKTAKYLESAGSFESIKTTASVTNTNPKALSATVIFSGNKSVKFDGATIESISGDKQKGSDDTIKTITNAIPTPPANGGGS